MKKLFFTLALALGLAASVSAQETGLFGYGPAKGGYENYSTDYETRESVFNLPNQHGSSDDVSAPLGMGTAILLSLGAAYLANKKRKNQKSYNTRFFLMAALITISSYVWADDTYRRITSTNDLVVGEKYIIVYEAKTKAMGTIGSNGKGQGISVTISDNSITLSSTSNVNVFTLGGDVSGYTLLGSKDNKYIGYKSSTDFETSESVSTDKFKWTINFSSTNATIRNVGTNTRYIKGYASNSDFRAYESNSGVAVQLYKLVYIITPAVNDASMGSATISGNTITATPNAGYRVKSGDEGYTVTAGTATVANNGDNTFTVTPASNCTVQINFEALPSHTLGTAVSPSNAGTVILGSSTLKEGTTTTATATADAGYKFSSWSIAGTGALLSSTTDNPTTVTMGTTDATITANFEEATTYAISYSVNGTIEEIKNVEENNPVDLSAPTRGVPAGFVFRGWVTSVIEGVQTAEPTYVTSATSTGNITYYAVMAMLLESGDDTYEKLDDQSFDADATYVIGAAQASADATMWYFKSYSKVDENASWGVMTSSPASDAPITFTLSGTANALVAKDDAGNYLKGVTSNFQMSSTSTTVAINESGAIQNASSTTYKLRHNYNSGKGGLRWYNSSTGTQAYFYKVIPGNVYGNFCTTVTNTFTADGNWNDATKWSLGIVPATGYAVTINADCTIPATAVANVDNITIGTGGSLTIADGGQLITNSAVQATVKKEIAKATNWGNATTYTPDGWYFIAAPISSISVESTNLTANQYDLYKFNQAAETTGEWQNYKTMSGENHANFSTLENGSGYLYANNTAITLSFTGEMVSTSPSITLKHEDGDQRLAGYNLIGNPFPCNATLSNESMPFYRLQNGIAVVSVAAGSTINPLEGIMVYVDASENVTFNKVLPVASAAPNHPNMNISLNKVDRSASVVDNAIISFNESNTLPKFYFGNPAANIYIPQDGKEFAIVSAEAQGEMPVNFKAAEDGQFTISVNVEDVEMSYLHLIDNLTGADVDLLATPSYTFNAKNDDYASRFRLVFSANNAYTEEGNDEFAFISNGQIILNGDNSNATLQMVDMLGRVVNTQQVNGNTAQMAPVANGVYVLRLIDGSNVKSQKIVVR